MTPITKHIARCLLCLACLLSLTTACSDEELVKESSVGKETWVDFHFGNQCFQPVEITTRATLGVLPESRVNNLFVFIFANSKRIYSHYFDNSNRTDNLSALTDKNNTYEGWYVANQSSEGGTATHGTAHIKCPTATNAKIYLIANIDADMVNIAPELLNTITTEQELLDLKATLNQETTSRNGYFPMSGSATIDITSAGITAATGQLPILLERLDAKIEVKVRVATAFETTSTEEGVTTTQTLKEFRPESWRIVNIPKTTKVIADATDAPTEYFNTPTMPFETKGEETFTVSNGTSSQDVTSAVNGFSFYMMENRPTAKTAPVSYHQRDLRTKNADGSYTVTGPMWVYAPEEGTYLEIKGEVVMVVDVSSEAKTQQLSADVTYYVHLGDFAQNIADFKVWRNTNYIYTITIKGVNSIQVEVESSQYGETFQEPESGATGSVYVAKESIFTFDAHYGQRVFCFDAANIDPNTVTWYVKTPFGREGTPIKQGDVEIPSGLDYKWVHFMVNEVSTTLDTESNEYPYSQNNQKYPGDTSSKLMDVVQFTKYMREQATKWKNGQANDFRKEVDTDWKTKFPTEPNKYIRSRIYVTVFIDEFYYDADPLTGEKPDTLWKKFVNVPNRLMHILCDSESSLDGASTATGSVITLRQHSIQTPYAIKNSSLQSAWGCETIDEADEGTDIEWFYETETGLRNLTFPDDRPTSNTSQDNGLSNTAILWDISSNPEWTDFLNYSRNNDWNILFLQDGKSCLRYSALMRNRDNNGNGVIDPEEVRWYIASLAQLQGLYIGEQGLTEGAKLFKDKYASAANERDELGRIKWRSHVVSSTYAGGQIIVWAEEGISTSTYKAAISQGWNDGDGGTQEGKFSICCIRNLGLSDATSTNINDPSANKPDELIKVTKPTGTITSSSVYQFDLSNVNEKSIRYYSSRELEPGDEFKEEAKVYKKFETGELINSGIYYDDINTALKNGISYCPDGYRMPNVREGAIMSLYCDNTTWWAQRTMVSTYFSFGTHGNDYYNSNKSDNLKARTWYFWYDGSSRGSVSETVGTKTTYIRTVKDVKD